MPSIPLTTYHPVNFTTCLVTACAFLSVEPDLNLILILSWTPEAEMTLNEPAQNPIQNS